MARSIKTVGVVGTGVIGLSWVGLFLSRGLRVLVSGPDPKAEEQVSHHLKQIWPLLERSGLLPGVTSSNWKFVGANFDGHWDELDFIQENAPERVDIKSKLIAELDHGTAPDVIIASSSSGLPSSQFINLCKKNAERVLIAHPFNPPHIMPLVEIVPHEGTPEEYIQSALSFYRSLGKAPIVVRKEVPGFIANRLQAAINNEAFSLVQRGIVTAKELDSCMMGSLGPSWTFTGPFTKDMLGGGANKTSGFSHLMEHVGVGMQGWLKDMAANSYEYTPENLKILNASVQEMLEGVDIEALEAKRNGLMMDVIKAKAAAKELI